MQLRRDVGVLERDDRDVVAQALGGTSLATASAHASSGDRARLTRSPARSMPALRGDATALDKPVGVQQQHVAAGERQLVLGTAAVGERPERGAGVTSSTRASGRDHQRRKVPGGRN